MRILTINYELPPLGGGGGVAAKSLAAELVRQGHQVDYVTSWFQGLARREQVEGIEVYREKVWGRKDLQTASIISMLSYPLAAYRRGVALAKRTRYDLIHTHFAIPSGPGAVLLARRLKLPHVLSVHGGDIYDPSKPYSPHRHPVLHHAVRGVLKRTDAVVCQSENTRQNTKSLYDFDRDIDLVPLAFQPAPFEPASRELLGLKPNGLYAIAVSRLIPRKGYRHLLTALCKANVPGLELIIVGDGPEREALSTLVGQLGIGSRVHFKGQLDEQSKFQYLSASDFFVLASLHEGFGIVFQEAMHCGLPIVTTNEGGQTDFLHHEQNALLCRPEDEGALAEYIRRMCEDGALRHRMSQNNRREIEAHRPGPIARKYVEIYERTIHTFQSR